MEKAKVWIVFVVSEGTKEKSFLKAFRYKPEAKRYLKQMETLKKPTFGLIRGTITF